MAAPSDDDILRLAEEWLRGFEAIDKYGLPEHKYVDPKDDAPHRRALASLLRRDKVPPEMRRVLASLIAPDSFTAPERRIEIGFRNEQRTTGAGIKWEFFLRGREITQRIENARKQKGSINKAITHVAEQTEMSEDNLKRMRKLWLRRFGPWGPWDDEYSPWWWEGKQNPG